MKLRSCHGWLQFDWQIIPSMCLLIILFTKEQTERKIYIATNIFIWLSLFSIIEMFHSPITVQLSVTWSIWHVPLEKGLWQLWTTKALFILSIRAVSEQGLSCLRTELLDATGYRPTRTKQTKKKKKNNNKKNQNNKTATQIITHARAHTHKKQRNKHNIGLYQTAGRTCRS